MRKFSRMLLTEWRRLNLPFQDAVFIAAVSGGADSLSLALALHELKSLKKLNLRFVIAHFNHNLREAESERDADFVREFAGKFNFELVYKTQNSNSKIQSQKGNLEQNARRARYEFLAETAENLHAYGILTAHTVNDQAETFLMNLIRGSGLEGLGGMKPARTLDLNYRSAESEERSEIETLKSEIALIRPLLSWAKRIDTENFCRENEIEFRNDAMNEDLAFNRVRIRKVLLPLLQDFNPKIVESLAKTAFLLREDFAELQLKIDERKPRADGGERRSSEDLSVRELKNVFPSLRRQVLRDWLREKRGDLRRLKSGHFEAIEKLIFSRKSGKFVELPGSELITKSDGKLLFQKTQVEKSR